jgi:hypothetical protein
VRAGSPHGPLPPYVSALLHPGAGPTSAPKLGLRLHLTEPGPLARQARHVIAETRASLELAAGHATGGATP